MNPELSKILVWLLRRLCCSRSKVAQQESEDGVLDEDSGLKITVT